MDIESCPCSGKSMMRLVRPAVMAVLAREPVHGYLIARRLSPLSIFRKDGPDPGAMYRVLRALEREGMVASQWNVGRGGPARRRYRLTPAGRRCLARWVKTLATYRTAIDELLGFARGPATAGHR